MYNLSIAASNQKRMNITLGIGQGSHVSHATEADRLTTPRKIKMTGAVEGEGVFNGSDDVLIYTEGGIERDYKWVKNKPRINGVEIEGDKNAEAYGIQPAGDYANEPITSDELDEIIDSYGATSEDVPSPEDEDADAMTHEDIEDILNGGVSG